MSATFIGSIWVSVLRLVVSWVRSVAIPVLCKALVKPVIVASRFVMLVG